MKIAITDLADYNNGVLRFEWLDLLKHPSAEKIGNYIEQFLKKRTQETGELHEEWFVTDYENFADLGEYPDLKDIEKAVALSQEHGWEVVAEYYEYFQELGSFEESFVDIWDSEEDFAFNFAHDIYSIEQLGMLAIYIDWQRFARDLFINDYICQKLQNYEIAVFRRL